MKPKIFILLPDGIGLRNFAYTRFPEIGKQLGFDIVYWNQTNYPIKDKLGLEELNVNGKKLHSLTTIYSRARKRIELRLWEREFKDEIYKAYNFPQVYNGLKKAIKSLIVDYLVSTKANATGLANIIQRIKKFERNTLRYELCKKQLKEHRPSIVFCTNQRSTEGIAPILAAQDLGIPTASFIFSWDNLPKATLVLETDFYFVWSDLMKKELQNYYPNLSYKKIFVSGTPQFEPHFDPTLIESRDNFFERYGLDVKKKYICFSGDDVTTSPDDPDYLEDTAVAVRLLNRSGYNLGLIFRRCPVDHSERYDAVVKKYKDVIKEISPIWIPIGQSWNQIFPTKEDLVLLVNTARHSELVLNLGSSMVFDFAYHLKPCCYFRYNQENRINKKWNIYKCYQYVHFRSMPSTNPVIWIKNRREITTAIEEAIKSPKSTIKAAINWSEVINLYPSDKASVRIWAGIEKILEK